MNDPIWDVWYKDDEGVEWYSMIQGKDKVEAEERFNKLWQNTKKAIRIVNPNDSSKQTNTEERE